jgi:hypothetical protein
MYFVSFPPIIEKSIMNVTFSLGHEPYQKIVINEQEFPINYLKKKTTIKIRNICIHKIERQRFDSFICVR